MEFNSCKVPSVTGGITNKGAKLFVEVKAEVEFNGKKYGRTFMFEVGPFFAS